MAGSGKIKQSDVNQLVHHMSKKAFRAKDANVLDEKILSHCLTLCGRDYKYSVLDNKNGELCNHYPPKLILLEYECRDSTSHHESIYNMQSLTDMFKKARFARCRTRFVMPVILIEGKHICRSATISGSGEVYGRLGLDLVFNAERPSNSASSSDANSNSQDKNDMQALDRIRKQDIKLLKELRVNHICDLMLENKKVKYFVNVTSSEKVDKLNRYSDFSVWSLPYPGCEFFKKWRDKDYDGERSVFDWSQDFVNSRLELPNERHLRIPAVHWHEYKTWSLVQITQNYLHVMLQHIQSGDSGLLVHCISGWDRTPLFVSLIRLSLWADGLIHRSLSPIEILYLTVAYDWYQFGHDLPDRLQKGEEILFFCFYFLKYIQDEDFVVHFPQQYTTPVLVPDGALRSGSCLSEKNSSGRRSDSPLVGSWQVVTGTGSYAESVSPHSGAELSNHSHRSSLSGEFARHSASLPELAVHQEPSQRRTRLEEVRSLFYNAYASTVGFKTGPDSGGVSSLFDMFADKVVALGNKLA